MSLGFFAKVPAKGGLSHKSFAKLKPLKCPMQVGSRRLLRDRFGAIFDDAGFADLYPARAQPTYAPWRLALVTLMQFREGLSDRQAAEAVRGRIDWKYLLALDLTDAGFDYSILCEFRSRLLEHKATARLLERVLDAARKGDLRKARSRQRTDRPQN
jgi:transposase